MDFKVGDKVLCIDNLNREDHIKLRTEYTVSWVYERDPNDPDDDGRIQIAELNSSYFFLTTRFIHAPTTELERFIYYGI